MPRDPDTRSDASSSTIPNRSRRTVLKIAGVGAGLAALGGASTGAAADQHESEEESETDAEFDADHFIEDLIDPTFGYPLAANETADVDLEHAVELVAEPGEGTHADFPQVPDSEGEDPSEFFFDPVGLQVEPDDLVQFRVTAGEHTVTAFHEKFTIPPRAIPTRVPDGVPGFTSPPILDGESWVYQFPVKGVYDILCLPHLFFGMSMRIVVFDPEEDDVEDDAFAAPTAGELPPNAERVLTADELDPANIVAEGSVAWEELTISEGSELETLFTYDPSAGELPENIAVGAEGTKYVSFPPRGEIREITPDNQSQSTLATFDTGDGTGVLGLEARPGGPLFACLVTDDTPDSDTHGIWRVTPEGDRSLFAELDGETFPNDILLDGDSLLVTDSIGGAVRRVREGEASEWVADPLLEGDGSLDLPFPIGANGIVEASDGTVYVSNTELGHIVEIPTDDGSAGTPEIFAEDERLVTADGLAIDREDDLYVGVNGQDTVVRVQQDGTLETLATAEDGLDAPSDVTFGTTGDEQTAVFITNYAVISMENPSLMKLDVGVPGGSTGSGDR